MTVRAAVESGAVVLNHAEVTGLRFTGGRVTGAELTDRTDGTEFGVDARLVLNATGPWVDRLRTMEDPAAAPSHPAVQGRPPGAAAQASRGRAALATPIDKYRITVRAALGGPCSCWARPTRSTTGDPADVRVTEADIRQILDEASPVGPRRAAVPRPDHLRLRGTAGAARRSRRHRVQAKRETVVTEGRGGMLSVAGGKWTTFRHIGRTVTEQARRAARTAARRRHGTDVASCRAGSRCRGSPTRTRSPTGCWSTRDPGRAHRRRTPRVTWPPTTARWPSTSPGWPPRTRRWPRGSTRTARRSGPRSSTRGTTSGPQTADDVLRRRTTLTIRGLDTDEVRAGVEDLLARG